MIKTTRIVAICLSAVSLSACMSYDSAGYMSYQPYYYDNRVLYSESYGSTYQYPYQNAPAKKPVVVPETYHVGAYHSPTRHKDRDQRWVTHQNPHGYTIQMAEGEKASDVANKLHALPKSERRAQIKYNRDGKTYYKGLYGSYPSYEAAQKALSQLPKDAKANAGIKRWGTVQNKVGNERDE